jgi:hypothetical protein
MAEAQTPCAVALLAAIAAAPDAEAALAAAKAAVRSHDLEWECAAPQAFALLRDVSLAKAVRDIACTLLLRAVRTYVAREKALEDGDAPLPPLLPVAEVEDWAVRTLLDPTDSRSCAGILRGNSYDVPSERVASAAAQALGSCSRCRKRDAASYAGASAFRQI